MQSPLIDLEGTWEEIRERMPDFNGQRVRVLVLPATKEDAPAVVTPSMDAVLSEMAAGTPAEELAKLPADFTDQLDHYIYGTEKR